MEQQKHIVEILESGDVKFAGRLISSAEFLVGTALCGLKNSGLSSEENSTEVKFEELSEISDCDDISEEVNVVSVSQSREIKVKKVLPQRTHQPVAQRKRKYDKFIQLPEDDVRLSYASDYFSAINSSDIEEYEKMLRKIAISKVVMVSRKNIPDPNIVPTHMEIIGIEAIVKMIEHFFAAIPDLIVKQEAERIQVYANGESCIECALTVTGTKIMEIEGVPEGSNDKVVLKSEMQELCDNIGNMNVNSKVVVVESEGANVKVPLSIGASQQKHTFTTPYTLSLHLNVNKQVFLIIFATD